MMGPGEYDAECTAARESAGAPIAILIIIGGDRGNGFSAQFITDVPGKPPKELAAVPALLRDVADQIERDQREHGLR